jgi:hypothetical protein
VAPGSPDKSQFSFHVFCLFGNCFIYQSSRCAATLDCCIFESSSRGSATSMDLAPPSKPFVKQACDYCRQREVKCSRELPCDKCQRLLLLCSYSDVLRDTGPKFRTLYPLAPVHPQSTRNDLTKEQFSADQHRCSDAQYAPYEPSDALSQLPPKEPVSSPDSIDSTIASVRCQSQAMPYICPLSPQILLAHVNVYMK